MYPVLGFDTQEPPINVCPSLLIAAALPKFSELLPAPTIPPPGFGFLAQSLPSHSFIANDPQPETQLDRVE